MAEDHPVNQTVIKQQLTTLGYTCDIVDNGVEALQAMEETTYRILIADCHMTEFDGYELTKTIRKTQYQ